MLDSITLKRALMTGRYVALWSGVIPEVGMDPPIGRDGLMAVLVGLKAAGTGLEIAEAPKFEVARPVICSMLALIFAGINELSVLI